MPQTRKAIAKRCVRTHRLKPFEVRCVEIKFREPESDTTGSELDCYTLFWRPLHRLFRRLLHRLFRRPRQKDSPKPNIKPYIWGPVSWVTALGFSFSVILLLISAVYGDGMSFCATISLSLLSSLAGWANRCKLKLPKRENKKNTVPLGDTVIRYPNGSFLVVKCVENVARELFFAPEELQYDVSNETHYRLISLVGTFLLMLGIVFLANATLPLQIGWGLDYGLINAAYWIVAALSPRSHWDFSAYELRDIGLASDIEIDLPSETGTHLDDNNERGTRLRDINTSDTERGENNTSHAERDESNSSDKTGGFTIALWKAIVLTKTVGWVRHNGAAPHTPAWDKWIKWAGERVHEIDPSKVNGNLRPIYGRTLPSRRSKLRKMFRRARAGSRRTSNSPVPHQLIWNDDLDNAKPTEKLIELMKEAGPILDTDGMPERPSVG